MAVEIIAEIAQGYEGNPYLAQLLAKGAVATGADAIKFQMVFADELAVPSYPYYKLFESLEMGEDAWAFLVDFARSNQKRIYFDVYGERSLSLAEKLKVDGVKISTTDFYNTALRTRALSNFQRVYYSIGGVAVEEIDELVGFAPDRERLTLLHGFQAEPTETGDNNLARIRTLKQRYPGVKIGFMDHSLGVSEESLQLPLVALGLGVDCIEKHITLDPALEIEDFLSALTPSRFTYFVEVVRQLETAMGSSELAFSQKEIEYKNRAGKVVVAKQDLVAGTRLTEKCLALKRVSTEPTAKFLRRFSQAEGKKLKSDLKKDQPLMSEILI